MTAPRTQLVAGVKMATCNAPNTNSVGLTIDTGTTLQDAGVNEPPIAQCTSCQSGTRQFYTSTTATVPSDAIGNMQVAEGVQCPTPANFCTCNSAGVCCTPSGAVDTVLFIPFCSGGTCVMDTVVQGDSDASLVCEDGTTFTSDSMDHMDDNFDEEDLLFDSSESEPDGGSNMESDDEVVPTKKRKHDEESKDDEMVNFSWFKKDLKAVNVFLQRAAMLLNSGLGLTDKSASHLCGYAGCLNFKHIVYESLDLNVSRERCPVMRKEACVAQCLCLPRCIPTSEHRYVKCAIHGKTCTVSEETFPPQIDFVPGHIISIAKGIAEFSDDLLRLLSYTLTAFRPGLKLIIQSEEQVCNVL
ncbi:hypothetical protein M3Y98_00104200 [Aphelenchoides besseyi]|nr:hypothetical protein M3Y98_00104200 [Aphelenchoides besseyi]